MILKEEIPPLVIVILKEEVRGDYLTYSIFHDFKGGNSRRAQGEKAELTEVSEHFEHKQQRRSYPLKSMKKKDLVTQGGKQGPKTILCFTLLHQTYLRVRCKRIIMFRIIMFNAFIFAN